MARRSSASANANGNAHKPCEYPLSMRPTRTEYASDRAVAASPAQPIASVISAPSCAGHQPFVGLDAGPDSWPQVRAVRRQRCHDDLRQIEGAFGQQVQADPNRVEQAGEEPA